MLFMGIIKSLESFSSGLHSVISPTEGGVGLVLSLWGLMGRRLTRRSMFR